MNADYSHINFYLFQQFKIGDERAFEVIFKTYYNQIVGFCNQFVNDFDEAKNISQEAFVKLWLNREKVEKPNGIRAFLYSSSKSDCLNYIRHKKVESKYKDQKLQEKENEINVDVLKSLDFDSLEFSELDKLVHNCIQELPERSRIVFVKSRFEGLKNKEIAAQLNISVKAVEANKRRALKHLKKTLSEILPLVLVLEIIRFF